MKKYVTSGIILTRINFRDADRIITILTPNYGKLKLIARGVRKIKSKIADSIELFSVSTFTIVQGKKEISILASSKLQTYFKNITEDYSRTMVGYEILKIINKSTREVVDSEYYELLLNSLTELNNTMTNSLLVKCWFMARQLKILGHEINTTTDIDNNKLKDKHKYNFDLTQMAFYESKNASYNANHIKLLRLLIKEDIQKLKLISNLNKELELIDGLLVSVLAQYKVN